MLSDEDTWLQGYMYSTSPDSQQNKKKCWTPWLQARDKLTIYDFANTTTSTSRVNWGNDERLWLTQCFMRILIYSTTGSIPVRRTRKHTRCQPVTWTLAKSDIPVLRPVIEEELQHAHAELWGRSSKFVRNVWNNGNVLINFWFQGNNQLV